MKKNNEKDNTVNTSTKSIKYQIPIITNSNYDLSKFDFSFVGIKIYDIESESFMDYIELNQVWLTRSYKFFLNVFDEDTFSRKKRYAIVKDKYDDTFNSDDVFNVFNLLKIIFPSNLKIERIYDFSIDDDIIYRNCRCSEIKYDEPESFLICADEQLQEINEFLKLVFDGVKSQSFIELTISTYLHSFEIKHPQFRFISLCICLETVIYGNSEICKRLAHSIAILCGKDKSNSKLISDNIKTIYGLRSKIVHGESIKSEIEKNKRFTDYVICYLEYLVSRMIIELLIHNLFNKEELNKCLEKLEFGQRNKISNNWKYFLLNPKNKVTECKVEDL